MFPDAEIQFLNARDGGLAHADLPALNRWLRRSVHSDADGRDYSRPIDLGKARLIAPHPSTGL